MVMCTLIEYYVKYRYGTLVISTNSVKLFLNSVKLIFREVKWIGLDWILHYARRILSIFIVSSVPVYIGGRNRRLLP